MLRVNDQLVIREHQLQESFFPSPGPGGQKVNKTSTAVRLRYDVAADPLVPAEVKSRLRALAGSRMTDSGEILIEAHRHRTRHKNRQDARERLVDLLRQAARPPKARRPTRTPRSAKRRRLEQKRRRSMTKSLRRTPAGD